MGYVWFGTREHMQWVTAPAVDVSASRAGFSASAQFMSGGAWVRRSKTGAKQFSFSWNMKRRADVQAIIDYAEGFYGDGYIYYSNPFAMDRNVLPPYWANPSLNAYDGPVVLDGVRPLLISGNSSVNGFPVEAAQYSVTSTSTSAEIYIPIPPTHEAHIGVHGSVVSGSANVVIKQWSSSVASTDVNATLLTKGELTNAVVSGGSYQGVSLSIESGSAGVLQLDGMIVQVLPAGSVSPSGAFISGVGHSGLEFVNSPALSEYSAAQDRVGVTAELIETEAWA